MLMRAVPPAAGLLLSLTLGLTVLPVGAVGPATFELTDGSVVIGELLGVTDGGFRVRSATLGDLTIDASRVRVMRQGRLAPDPEPAPSPGTGPATGQLEAMQRQMVGNPEIMALIMQLRDDPQTAKALWDPAFLNAVSGGNLATLQEDPRIQELMNNPIVRSLIERMAPR